MNKMYGITKENMIVQIYKDQCFSKDVYVVSYLDDTPFMWPDILELCNELKFVSKEYRKASDMLSKIDLTKRQMQEFVYRSNYRKLPPSIRNLMWQLMEENEMLEKGLDKACEELKKMSYCKDCYEYQEKGCPFICDGKRCHGECRDAEKWKEWCMEDE